jgi:hypothetical protein
LKLTKMADGSSPSGGAPAGESIIGGFFFQTSSTVEARIPFGGAVPKEIVASTTFPSGGAATLEIRNEIDTRPVHSTRISGAIIHI